MVTIEITYHMDEHLCPSEELSAGINLLNKDVLCCQLPYTGEWLYNASPGHATKWVVEHMNGYHGLLLAPKQISHLNTYSWQGSEVRAKLQHFRGISLYWKSRFCTLTKSTALISLDFKTIWSGLSRMFYTSIFLFRTSEFKVIYTWK